MNRSYLARFVPLFIVTSTPAIAADWDKAHNNVVAFFGMQSNNNVFNTAEQRQADVRQTAGVGWDWLGLFEGYGVQLPVQVSRQNYRDTADLAETLYKLQPQMRFFLSAQTDLAIQATLEKDQILAGDGAAEFLQSTDKAFLAEHSGLEATVQFGRAPDTQNLRLTVGTDQRQQRIRDKIYSELDSDSAQGQYSHKLNENIALIVDVASKQENQNRIDSSLLQYGAGISVQWTGQQFFRLTGGRYDRRYPSTVLSSVSGSFWQLDNLWQFDERWQLQVQSGRSSVLSYATTSISQLDTHHLLSLRWQYDQSHQFGAEISRLISNLDQDKYYRTRSAVGANWRWQWAQQWHSVLQLSQVRQSQHLQADRNRLELAAEVTWSW